ncbi:MAG: GNAT family N-acetyltransferase [Candidatus Helarchaeota archaeon]
MIIRTYRTESIVDYEALKNLMVELCLVTGSAFDEKRFQSGIQRRAMDKYNRQGILVAEDKNKIVGMVIAEILVSPFIETFGSISNFVVSPDYRGKGVGNQLIEAAMKFFKKMGVNRVETNIRDLDKEGQVFLKNGFEKKYIVMEKRIPMEEFSKPY